MAHSIITISRTYASGGREIGRKLAERLGFKIKLVDCGYRNIKITTPEDLKLAEQLLKENG